MLLKVFSSSRTVFAFAGVVIKYLTVTVSDYPSQSLVERSLVLGVSETVYENEIRIAFNGCPTRNSVFSLKLLFFEKSFLNDIHHRYFALAVFGLWCVDAKRATVAFAVVIIDKRVIDVDASFFKVDIAPT